MAGYSGTPLAKKLGIKAGQRVVLIDAPKGFAGTLGALPDAVTLMTRIGSAKSFDVGLAFFLRARELEMRFDALAKQLDPTGGLWIAWPKKSSGVTSDLDEGVVRKHGLSLGLVDNKVCAIDETWSGLRFVVRLKDRPTRASKPPAKR